MSVWEDNAVNACSMALFNASVWGSLGLKRVVGESVVLTW